MGLITKINITSDFIYQHLTDEDIYCAYRDGDFEVGSIESSKFREDSSPSAGFYINSKDKIIYNDLATGEKLDAAAYVGKMFKLSYKEALNKIAEDFGLTGGLAKYSKVDLEKARQIRESATQEKIIEVIEDRWSVSYLDYWKQFELTKKEIENEVIPIKTLIINGQVIPNYSKNIRFAYPVYYNNKTYYKVYTPYNDKDNFRWINNIPIYIPFGIFDLPFKSKTLIITKSVKEKLLFNKFLTDIISIQNESQAALRDKTIEWLWKKYDTIWMFPDNDKAGIDCAHYFGLKGFNIGFTPEVSKKFGIKDWAEFVQHYGIKKFEDYLKFNELLI